jgi:hypothetical protein
MCSLARKMAIGNFQKSENSDFEGTWNMNTASKMKKYFVAVDGQQSGPLTAAQVTDLVHQGKINNDSMAICEGMAAWTPLGKLEEFSGSDNFIPPPLSVVAPASNGGSNVAVWVLAFAPFLGLFLQIILASASRNKVSDFWWVTLVLNIFLCVVDCEILKRRGIQVKNLGSQLLVPVYLFKRSKMLGHKKTYFIVWCIMFAFSALPRW